MEEKELIEREFGFLYENTLVDEDNINRVTTGFQTIESGSILIEKTVQHGGNINEVVWICHCFVNEICC